MFVIRRTDQGGGYVAPSGSKSSYTRSIHAARLYDSESEADADRCPDNEVIVQFFPSSVGPVRTTHRRR